MSSERRGSPRKSEPGPRSPWRSWKSGLLRLGMLQDIDYTDSAITLIRLEQQQPVEEARIEVSAKMPVFDERGHTLVGLGLKNQSTRRLYPSFSYLVSSRFRQFSQSGLGQWETNTTSAFTQHK